MNKGSELVDLIAKINMLLEGMKKNPEGHKTIEEAYLDSVIRKIEHARSYEEAVQLATTFLKRYS